MFVNNAIAAAVPLDAKTIAFLYRRADCDILNTVNIPVIPAHVFDADFAANAATAFNGQDNLAEQFTGWMENYHIDFGTLGTSPENWTPTVTAGDFGFDSVDAGEHVRLLRGDLGFEVLDVADRQDEVARFLSGELSVIVNPPYETRADIRAAADVQVVEYPGNIWYAIGLNLADPRHPQSIVDRKGNPADQGVHPIFGDVQVRRALQMALDVPALIAGGVDGNGSVIARISRRSRGRTMPI